MTNEQSKLARVEMDLGPVWNARIDLTRVTGILGAVIYLIRREDDNGERDEIVTALAALQETLADCAEGLDGAIKGMKIVKEAAS